LSSRNQSPKYPKKKTLSTLRISDCGFEVSELDSVVEIYNPQSQIQNVKGAHPGTPLPVSAPQLNPAFVASYTGYQEYIGQIVSSES